MAESNCFHKLWKRSKLSSRIYIFIGIWAISDIYTLNTVFSYGKQTKMYKCKWPIKQLKPFSIHSNLQTELLRSTFLIEVYKFLLFSCTVKVGKKSKTLDNPDSLLLLSALSYQTLLKNSIAVERVESALDSLKLESGKQHVWVPPSHLGQFLHVEGSFVFLGYFDS